MTNQKAKHKTLSDIYHLRTMVLMSLLIAMSIVFGKVLAINVGGTLRISFENLPILMAGILISPAAGFLTGAMADIIGCLIVGYAINPIISLGAASIGLVSGLLYQKLNVQNQNAKLITSVMTAHVVGSMLIKSAGLMISYGYTIQSVALRVPLYIGIGIVESIVMMALLKNHAFTEQLERIQKKR